MDDEMKRIVVCKHCDTPEYYGEMRWLNGMCGCRNCYKSWWEACNHKLYGWNDLDGQRPSIDDYKKQESLYIMQ